MTVDVGGVKPTTENSGLRFLWARHKITLLSDYNFLRKDDRRVQEVTDLGLRYNLLTAYTSFVAIDSEVRNRNGKPTEVRQPLPLPQGVSDYAVGGKAMAAVPARLSTNLVAREAAEPVRQKQAELKKNESDQAIGTVSQEVKASGNIDQEEVLRIVKKHLEEIKGCLPKGLQKGRLILKIRFQGDGKIKEVIVESPASASGEKCLTGYLKKWTWPPSQDGRQGEITVTINLDDLAKS